jgi:hypothetical protein
MEAGQTAILEDDLASARLSFEDALRIRPGDTAALTSISLVEEITASRELFEEATTLLERNRFLLEARELFLAVPENDLLRHETAQQIARIAEKRWIDEAMSILNQRFEGDDFGAVALSISEFRRQLPRSELLEAALAASSEAVIEAAVRNAMLRVESGELPAARQVLSDARHALRNVEEPPAFTEVRQAIDRERDRQAAQREGERAQQQNPRRSTPPSPSTPARGTVDGCPAPSPSDRAWEKCLNERALAETGCPSVIYDADAWRECVFGDGDGAQPSPPTGETQGPAPQMLQIGVAAAANDGLTVTVVSLAISERPGSFIYTISYRLENRTDRAIDEGSFKLYGPSDNLPQYGFFSRMFPTDVVERTAVFEEVKSTRFDIIAYHSDQFFAQRPPAGSLAWSIPQP